MNDTNELNDALRGLLRELQKTRASALEARDTLGKLVHVLSSQKHSHHA